MLINILILIVVFVFCFLKFKGFSKNLSFRKKLYITFYTIEHFVITGIFSFFLGHFSSVNDPQRFYARSLHADSWISLFGFGNRFMSFIVYPLAKIGVSLETLFFLFSAIGWLGFLNLFNSLDFKNQKNISFFYLMFLIPSIHLWTSSLSKEPLLLFFLAIIISKVNDKSIINYISLICLMMILFIRPHVFFIISGVFLMIYIFKIKNSLRNKIYVTLGSLTIFLISLYVSLIYFLKAQKINFDYFYNRYQLFVEFHSNTGDAGINLETTNVFERLLYILYMPLPILYNSKNFFQLYISIENLIYVLFSLYVSYLFFVKKTNTIQWNNNVIFTLSISLLLIILFGSYVYNLGLGNRMRIMFYPTLFYFFIKIEQQSIFANKLDT